MANRSFLLIHYKLFHHLDRLKKGQAKAQCLSVYLSLMKYAWKSKGYMCAVRYSTIEKDTLLSKMTVRRSIVHLAKLNIIEIKRLSSANKYKINPVFLVSEKSTREHTKVYERTFTGIGENIINKNNINNINNIQYTNIDKIIANGNDKDSIVRQLADTIALPDLLSDKRNVYYCKLAIALKEENDKPKVKLNTGAVLKDLKKKTNAHYRHKVEYNKRNNLDWKGRPKN